MSKRYEVGRKWETIRRLRYGCLIRLFRHRYGHQLPDDDAGIADLWLLLQNVSLAIGEPEKKMRHVIAVWAPWLSEEAAQERIEFLGLLMNGPRPRVIWASGCASRMPSGNC